MSLGRMCGVHTLKVLTQTASVGTSLGLKRTYAATRTLKCRVIPLGAVAQIMLGARGQRLTHKVRFASDPGLTEDSRVQWVEGNNTIMRVSGVPVNPHGQGRVWTVMAEALTEDNAVVTEIA